MRDDWERHEDSMMPKPLLSAVHLTELAYAHLRKHLPTLTNGEIKTLIDELHLELNYRENGRG